MHLTDDQIRAMMRDTTKYPPSARHLGMEVLDFSIEGGWADSAFTPRPEFSNPAGMVQGGFIAAMLDDAMGVAVAITQRFTVMVPTLQLSVAFLRPTPVTRILGRGEVLRLGSSTAQLQGSLRLPDGTLLATAMASASVRPFPKPE